MTEISINRLNDWIRLLDSAWEVTDDIFDLYEKIDGLEEVWDSKWDEFANKGILLEEAWEIFIETGLLNEIMYVDTVGDNEGYFNSCFHCWESSCRYTEPIDQFTDELIKGICKEDDRTKNFRDIADIKRLARISTK